MNVLVACEFSGAVRDAFRRRGHNATSVDLEPSETPGPHIIGDALDVVNLGGWDMLLAFPPCTHLAVSGARWWASKPNKLQAEAVAFVRALLAAPINHIAVENPVGAISSQIRPPDQIIHPWEHGHGETKATCLWLKNLPALRPTNIVQGRIPRIHMLPPSPVRAQERSRTYTGIAEAMADQWGTPAPVQSQMFEGV